MNIETKIKLNKFKPRDYQMEILRAWRVDGYKKIFYCLGRRSGKDYLAWNMAIWQCTLKPCMVLYCLPTYSQARKCIFDAIGIDGVKFLDLIPSELVAKINVQEMKITFSNGSILRLIGASSCDNSLVGTNAQMIVLSEAALMNLEKVYAYARPILAANGGVVVILSTPRGKNAFWRLYEVAKKDPNWFVMVRGADETKHIPEEVLAEERLSMSEDLYQQEYMCSFTRGVEGQIYGRELQTAYLEERVGYFPHQPQLLTHLALDIGVNDATTLLWFQIPNEGNGPIFIIDSYSNTNMGLDHYAKLIQDKPYRMGKYFAPHDISVKEWGGGAISRYEKARQMGIDFETLQQASVQDGIDHVKLLWPRFHINQSKCKTFLNAMENYKRVFDEDKQIYSPKPLHNWASDYADALRYLCQSVHLTKSGMTSQEFDAIRRQALYGDSDLPGIFRENKRYDRGIF